jgi:hypothetical protein
MSGLIREYEMDLRDIINNNKEWTMKNNKNESNINELFKALEKSKVKNPSNDIQSDFEDWDKFSGVLSQLTDAMLSQDSKHLASSR